jgi:hypothetical protein
MKKVKGEIEIDFERKTVSIQLDNDSWCTDLYTHGLKRFLDEEIEFVRKDIYGVNIYD